jgi:hypothetical protein
MKGPITATVTALLFTLRRSPIPTREKIEALEKTAALLRMRADEAETEELELLVARS